MSESIGLAKTAPEVVIQPPVEQNINIKESPRPQTNLSIPSWESIPMDLMRYLSKDIGKMTSKDIEQLKDIDKWSKEGLLEDSIGNRLEKIRDLETRLGQPGFHETRVDRIWNWVRMQFNINELRKRQESFERKI